MNFLVNIVIKPHLETDFYGAHRRGKKTPNQHTQHTNLTLNIYTHIQQQQRREEKLRKPSIKKIKRHFSSK